MEKLSMKLKSSKTLKFNVEPNKNTRTWFFFIIFVLLFNFQKSQQLNSNIHKNNIRQKRRKRTSNILNTNNRTIIGHSPELP